jgi:hypothetical protein
MNYLFSQTPILVAGHNKSKYKAGYAEDLERRAIEFQNKRADVTHEEVEEAK